MIDFIFGCKHKWKEKSRRVYRIFFSKTIVITYVCEKCLKTKDVEILE